MADVLVLRNNVDIGNGHSHGQTAPLAGFIFSIVLAMLAISVLSFCLARRSKPIQYWGTMPLARWLILGVYADSWAFVFSSTILQSSLGLNSSHSACDAAILLCLVCYLTSKILYFFLVEKVWIIRGSRKPRHKDPLYIFNSIGMLIPYCTVISLTFVFRRADIATGECRIGLRLPANVPLLVFDICINVYLTALFLQPLKQMYSYKGTKGKLRTMARRTFIGSALTLITTVSNLTAVLVLKGREPGWICFACCNADVLFSALVLHWVTHVETDDDPTVICGSCQIKMPKHSLSSGTHNQARVGFDRTVKFGGDVTTDITAVKKPSKREKLETDAIPMGKIACRIETTQDRQDVESVETGENDYTTGAKAGSADRIHVSPA